MKRYDSAKLSNIERTPQGGLKVEGTLTKVGIFSYRGPNGTERKEYRPPEEVFSGNHMATFKGAPVTIGHPGLVTTDNWKEVSVGHVGEDVRQDAGYLKGTMYIQDANAINAIEQGGLKELSCGYDVDLDETPGEVNGERYDAVQRNIRGNHVAMLPYGGGRAGRDVAMRLDSAGDEELSYTETTMADKTVEQPGKTKIEAQEVNIRVDGQPEIDRLTAENEMLKTQLAEKSAQLADNSRLDSLVQERVDLITSAKEVLGDSFSPAGKTNKQIKTEVAKSRNPKLKQDGSDDYINAAYEMALTMEVAKPHASLGQVRADATNAAVVKDAVAESRARNLQASRDAWKTPLMVNK